MPDDYSQFREPWFQETLLRELLADPFKRLNTLYRVKDTTGANVPFRLNPVQTALLSVDHPYIVVLKSRQHGISTAVQYYMLDRCLFESNLNAVVIADTKDTAVELFNNKIKFAYDNLPELVKQHKPATNDAAQLLKFANGSSIRVGTVVRGGTFQMLHVSEYGKIAATNPEKAKEIQTGALNTVHTGQRIFIESTAEGTSGAFYKLCQDARYLEQLHRPLSPMEPKIFFFPWYADAKNQIAGDIPIEREIEEYLDGLGVPLTREQRLWYQLKKRSQGDYMFREFPSTPDEAFEASSEGKYYAKEMAFLRSEGRIDSFPWDPKLPVYTGWDLGGTNYTSIWFMQIQGNVPTMIRYYENFGHGLDHYAKYLNSLPYVYAKHYFPHDGASGRLMAKHTTLRETAEELGIRPITVVPRTADVNMDILTKCKPRLIQCRFDAVQCARGIQHLDNYTRKWDTTTARWSDKPMHNESSDGADAFRTLACSILDNLELEAIGVKGPATVFFDEGWRQVPQNKAYGNAYGWSY